MTEIHSDDGRIGNKNVYKDEYQRHPEDDVANFWWDFFNKIADNRIDDLHENEAGNAPDGHDVWGSFATDIEPLVTVVPRAGAGKEFLADAHNIFKDAADEAAQEEDLPPLEVPASKEVDHADCTNAVDWVELTIEQTAAADPNDGAIPKEIHEESEKGFVDAAKNAANDKHEEKLFETNAFGEFLSGLF